MLVGKVITRTCLHHGKAVVALREIPMAVMGRNATTVAATKTSSSSRHKQQEDLVKATIHRMIMEQEERHHFQENNSSSSATSNSTVVVTEEALQKASHCLRKKLNQVKDCLSDVKEEQAAEHRATELQTADMALEQAKSAHVDLIDLVRELADLQDTATTTAVNEFQELRQMSAAQIREYRHELEQYYSNDRQEKET